MDTTTQGCMKMLWSRFYGWFRQIWSQWSSDPLERCRWVKLPSSRQSLSEKPKDQLARAGEDAAALYLESKGLTILHRNVRFPEGELDLIAKSGKTLVFVEVKTRVSEKFGSPYQSVSEGKQRRQAALASRFVSLCRLHAVPIRFDVVSVVMQSGQLPKTEHIEHAFLVKDL